MVYKKIKFMICLIVFMISTIGINQVSFADCDDGPGPCWITNLIIVGAVTGGIANASSIGFNLYNTVDSRPMNKLSKGLTYGTFAVGGITLGTGMTLFLANHSRRTSTNVYNSIVVATGVATIGSGIMSLVVDHKQRRQLSLNSISPIVAGYKSLGFGLTIGGRF